MIGDHTWPVLITASIVGVLGSARLVRLIVFDDFPPAVWFRTWFINHTNAAWGVLVECGYCVAPYVVAPNLAAALIWDIPPWWWVLNGFFAAAYLASVVVAYDGSD